mmetsp:Transcript_38707/g.46881  ORF Transcript_38707/g.46881 Transcript_38707/m.46881 type:complete len:88 (+) Transcript_38707:160-423(+)
MQTDFSTLQHPVTPHWDANSMKGQLKSSFIHTNIFHSFMSHHLGLPDMRGQVLELHIEYLTALLCFKALGKLLLLTNAFVYCQNRDI